MKIFTVKKIEIKFFWWSLLFLVLTILLKWRLTPNLTTLLYTLGAVIGIFMLDVMENIIDMDPSPLRGILAQLILFMLTVFSLTSSGNLLGKGVVLLLNLKYLYLARQEFMTSGNLINWFKQVNITITPKRSEAYLLFFTILIILEVALFVLV